MPMPGTKELEPTTTHKEEEDPHKFHQTFETITEAEYQVEKDAWKIIMLENPSPKELMEMRKLNRVNCLHRGNFVNCAGKKYMVCVDGTASAKEAFQNTLKLLDPKEDHLFIVLGMLTNFESECNQYERGFYQETSFKIATEQFSYTRYGEQLLEFFPLTKRNCRRWNQRLTSHPLHQKLRMPERWFVHW